MRGLAFLGVLFVSGVALACPVCGAATDTQEVYKSMTVVMSLLPLAVMGSVVGFIAYRAKRADREVRTPPPQ